MPEDKPAPVSLNLDTLEREGSVEAFSVVLGGRPYNFLDPQDIDWQQLMQAMLDPMLFFRLCLSEKDSKAFLAQHLPAWKMTRLMDEYMRHFGLPSAPEADALPPS